jgi:uncharacterized phage infection (PIP) family protein YhgE
LRSVRASAADVAKGGLKQFADGARTLAGATEEAASKTDALSASFKNVKDGAQTSDQAADVATAGFDAITGSVQNAATALGILPELFGVEANATNAATAAHNAHTEALAAARKAVDAALASLVKLAESGDRNSEAFLQASNALKSPAKERCWTRCAWLWLQSFRRNHRTAGCTYGSFRRMIPMNRLLRLPDAHSCSSG